MTATAEDKVDVLYIEINAFQSIITEEVSFDSKISGYLKCFIVLQDCFVSLVVASLTVEQRDLGVP